MNEFKENMLRDYTPYFKFNAFSKDDIEEIKNVIEYSRGLVIMDKFVADSLETNESLEASAEYLNAINNTFDKDLYITEFQKNQIINNYKELNKYYRKLYDDYGIEYYKSRQATDFKILKTTINTLDKFHKEIFDTCYYEALNYMMKVTYTVAFKNQTYFREFYRQHLIFMTIQRYINKIMSSYFNIDTYNSKNIKNGFISNGFDYFDSIPLNYQRRIYKMLNTLIRNKGTNKVFDYILDIFSFDNIQIYKYPIVKTNDNDIKFFKVPINDNLNINDHSSIDFDKMTEKDPYWRTDKEDILECNFNVLNSKYLSADVLNDLNKISMQMAYFFSLINYVELKNENLIKDYMNENKVSYDIAYNEVTIQDVDFYFYNRNISDKKIKVFDALIAVIFLIFKRMDLKDYINDVDFVNHVYGYNNLETDNDGIINEENPDYSIPSTIKLLNELKQYVYYNKTRIQTNEWEDILNFLNEFKLRNFDHSEELVFNSIKREFKSNPYYLKVLGELALKDFVDEDTNEVTGKPLKIILTKYKEDRIYECFSILINMILSNERLIRKSITFKTNETILEFLSAFPNFNKLLGEFVSLKYFSGELSKETIFNFALNSIYINKDITSLVKKINTEYYDSLLNDYKENKNIDNLEKLLKNLISVVNNNEDISKTFIIKYPNLSTFLEIFNSYDNYIKENFTMEDFSKIFIHNEKIRKQLEKLILETNDYTLYKSLNQIWHNKFVTNIDNSLFKDNEGNRYKTFTDYLKDKDQNLYFYISVDSSVDYTQAEIKGIYRDKIFELIESIDNHLNLSDFNFLLQNNFIGLSEYIKLYIYLLIRIFKAYTTETVFTNTIWKFDDNLTNSIRVFDSIKLDSTGNQYRDELHLIDNCNITSKLILEEEPIDIGDSFILKTFEKE